MALWTHLTRLYDHIVGVVCVSYVGQLGKGHAVNAAKFNEHSEESAAVAAVG